MTRKEDPKAQQAAALRRKGMPVREIGAELGVSHETARKWCASILGTWRPERRARPRHACPRCSKPALGFCASCRQAAANRGVRPEELPPVGELGRSPGQVEAARRSVAKATAARVEGRAKKVSGQT